MKAGQASITAQRVAAHRLGFPRVPAPYGRPGDDEVLARDVAGAAAATGSTGGMVAYLAARTAFFDRVVTGALDARMHQVVVAAAGYDGRSLRYAKPGVRWFELDHPDTQADKLERLRRLGLDTGHVTFVAADFAEDPVGPALAAAGYSAEIPGLFLVEGVAVYLDGGVLESLLAGLRSVAAPSSRLAISLSVRSGSAETDARREAFQAAVAAMGEPARNVLTADSAAALLADTRWRVAPDGAGGADRARAAGLVLAEPVER